MSTDIALLTLLLSLAVSGIAWTVAEEYVFEEFRGWLRGKREHYMRNRFLRYALYPPLCVYCFGVWTSVGVALVFRPWGSGVFEVLGSAFALSWLSAGWTTLYRILRLRIVRLEQGRALDTRRQLWYDRQMKEVQRLDRERAQVQAMRNLGTGGPGG